MSKKPVIANIKKYAKTGELNHKVELGDPHFTPEQSAAAIAKFYQIRRSPLFPFKRWAAYQFASIASKDFMKDFEIVGLEKLTGLKSGAIVTSNHFNPMDTMLPRAMAKRCGRHLFIVSQDTNLALPKPLNFITNHTDLIPLPATPSAIVKTFKPKLKAALSAKNFVLIYPEEEMWYNYRKPRPCKRGAYQFAAECKVPIISCFTEMIDTARPADEEFNQVRFRLHVLGVLRPDPQKSPRANSLELSEQDYALKKSAYEQIYGKSLDYTFAKSDIAGLK